MSDSKKEKWLIQDLDDKQLVYLFEDYSERYISTVELEYRNELEKEIIIRFRKYARKKDALMPRAIDKETAVREFTHANDTYYHKDFKKYVGNEQCFRAGFDAGAASVKGIDKEKLIAFICKDSWSDVQNKEKWIVLDELKLKIESGEFDIKEEFCEKIYRNN